MSKKKMGKVLAAALCATTVATFYAAPVMAADLTSPNGNNKLTVNNNAITGVVDSDKKGSKNEFTINDQVTQFKTTVVQDSGRNKISSIRQNHEGVRLRAAEWTDGTATNGRFSDVLVTADSVKFGQGVNNPDITPNYTFTVDTKTGNLTAGTINGATINKDGINGAVITENSFNGVNVGKVAENVAGITRENGVTNIEGRVNVDKLGNVKAHGNVWSETGLTVGKVGEKAYFAVNGKGDVVTEGTINDVTLKKDGIKFGKVSILETKAGNALINGNVIGFDGITATGDLNVGLSGKFSVNGATGNLTTEGTINGAAIRGNSFNGAVILGQKFNGVNVQELKAQVDGLNGNVATTNKNVAGIERTYTEDVLGQRDYTTTIEGTLSANDKGVSVGKDGKEVFHVSAVNGNVTGGLYNGVNVEELQETTSKINEDTLGINRENGVTTIEGVLDITSKGDIKLKNGSFAVDYNGNMTAANGAFKASQHGITVGDNAFHVDAATGNVTGGLYNGVDVKALSENVGSVNKNVAGIKRIGDEEQGYATVIEDKLQVGSDRMQVSYDGTGFVMTNTGTSFTGNVNLGDRASFNYGGSSINLNDFYADYQAHLENVKDYSDRLNALEDKTQHITADENGTTIEGNVTVNGDLTANNITADGVEAGNGGNINANGTITGGTITGGTINGEQGTIGGVTLENGKVNGADITENSFNGVGMENGNITTDGKVNAGSANIGGVEIGDNKVNVGKTEINKDGVTVGKTEITDNDVVINKGDKDKEVSLQGTANKVDSLAQGMADMNGRINQVDEKINKVGAMAAAIANLRTMGYDPTAPTEIAVGVGQYRDETGAALGFFHYPNKNFMLSMSVSTSGDEVMGGIGATWKFGNKSKQESTKVEAAKVEEVKAEKADEIKKAARVAAQQKRHAEMAAKASK